MGSGKFVLTILISDRSMYMFAECGNAKANTHGTSTVLDMTNTIYM
jgi:hypothetical protein